MTINGLTLPIELEADLQAGGLQLQGERLVRLKELLTHLESPLPKLYATHDDIIRESQFWTTSSSEHYLGTASLDHLPGDIDPALALTIGEAEPDSPIALDYRTDEPRVVYLGDADDEAYWFELSSSYKNLRAVLQV